MWGHPSHPGVWVNAEHGVAVSYLRALHALNGGPPAMADFISDNITPSNLEKIADKVDMDVSHPISYCTKLG
jgi:hypothetical protein